MKLIKLIIILSITIIVSVLLNFYLINKLFLFSYKEVAIDFKVGDHLGFNSDKDFNIGIILSKLSNLTPAKIFDESTIA